MIYISPKTGKEYFGMTLQQAKEACDKEEAIVRPEPIIINEKVAVSGESNIKPKQKGKSK
jgi:hypothetical protein